MPSELEIFFKEKIAALDGIEPEEVTQEYIDARRREIYHRPSYRIDFPSNYGGYNTIGLRILTPLGLEAMNRESERLFERGR